MVKKPGFWLIVLLGMVWSGLLMAVLLIPQTAPAAGSSASLIGTATVTPTRTTTPTPTPTRAVVSGLVSQLSFFGGGGGMPACDLNPPDTIPAVRYRRTAWEYSDDRVCLYGFVEGETVQVKIFTPDNTLAASVPVYIRGELMPGEAYTLNQVNLPSLPLRAPKGKWRVSAVGSQSSAAATFNQPGRDMSFTITRAVEPGAGWYDPRRMKTLVLGDTLAVDGANYPHNQDIPVGIYTSEGSLVTAQMARTDNSGSFYADFNISGNFRPGRYFVFDNPGTNQETTIATVPSIFFRVVRPVQACPNSMLSFLEKDKSGKVNLGPPNNVREKPGLSSRLLGKLNALEKFTILAGPKCANGMVWWKVASENTGLDGWTAEGQNGSYWLTPDF